MKLKKLTIHNIASIEDAVIDFSGDALARQDLFLICGPTGAGKSTILDAICLALFNTTPRICNSVNENIDVLADDSERKKEKVRDVMHLVRKNAPEAWVTLSFEGVDGRECAAAWRVRRKVRKCKNETDQRKYESEPLEEKLKRGVVREWSLTDGDGQVYEKSTEVEARIQDLIKMNFDQFCKTTLLAQGDFTKFLSSKSDDKAQILEKLVGTEKYAEVGAVINARTNAMRNEVEVLQRALENCTFLTDAQKDAYATQLAQLEAEGKALDAQMTATNQKMQWLTERNRVTQLVVAAQTDLEKAEVRGNSEEVKQMEAQTLLWDATVEVRAALAALKQAQREAQRQTAVQQHLQETFDGALGAWEGLKLRTADLERKGRALKQHLVEQAPYEPMFQQADVIGKDYEDWCRNRLFEQQNVPQLKAYDALMEPLTQKVAACAAQMRTKEVERAKLMKQIDAMSLQLNDLAPARIRKEDAACVAHQAEVTNAEGLLSTWATFSADAEAKLQLLQQAEVQRQSAAEALKHEEVRLQQATKVEAESRRLYERTKASVDDHAKVLRAELKVGDVCPVCGHRVDAVLSDATFEEMLAPLRQKWEADVQLLDSCRQQHAQAEATAQTRQVLVTQQQKSAADAQKKALDEWSKLQQCCSRLQVVLPEAPTYSLVASQLAASLTALKSHDEAQHEVLKRSMDAADALEKQLKELQTSKTTIDDGVLKPLQKEMDQCNQQLSQLKGNKEKLNGELATRRAHSESLVQDLKRLIHPDWGHPESLPASAYAQLKQAAEAYRKDREEVLAIAHTLETCQKDLKMVELCHKAIVEVFADWKDRSAAATEADCRCWVDLQAEVQALATAMARTRQSMQEQEAVLTAFKEQHADIPWCRIESLAACEPDAIASLRQQLQEVKEAVLKARMTLQAHQKHLAEMSACQLEAGEDEASLQQRKAALGELQQKVYEQKGSIGNELEADKKNRETQGRKKEELDAKKGVYAQWKLLDQYLGSTDGKNFRNVAQSFILSDLLDKANAYLETITGRYSLFCNPGTLTIMMRDAYQGGVVRPTNTLSGGESFIISLSLALGLSSMQSVGLEVDTLFIDEGFGTLSPEFLDPVICSLKRLYEKYNRRVGIISHVEALKARIPVTIEVTREGNSSSRVEVVAQ